MKSLLKISALTLVIQDTRTKWRPGDILLISGPEVRRKRNWSEIRIFMPAAPERTTARGIPFSSVRIERFVPIFSTVCRVLPHRLPRQRRFYHAPIHTLPFPADSFLSIASYLRIGSMKAVLNSPRHPEYGDITVPFPIPRDEYDTPHRKG